MITALLIIVAVLFQKSKKEGGADPLASSSTAQLVGVTKSSDILEQITWSLVAILVLLTFMGTFQLKKILKKKRK